MPLAQSTPSLAGRLVNRSRGLGAGISAGESSSNTVGDKPINTLAKWPKPCPICQKRVLRSDSYAQPDPFDEIYHFDCIYPIHPQQLELRIRP